MKKYSFVKISAIFFALFILVSAGDVIYKKTQGNMSAFLLIKEASWENGRELILVNSRNRVPDDYETDLVTLANGEKVDSQMYPFLQNMFDDMREQGYYPVVVSGYRDEKKQQSIFEGKYISFIEEGYSNKQAKELTGEWVALPGTSEHELGLAVDINPDRSKSGNEVYGWLENNAYKYGFIKRYPSHKSEITGIMNEDWHYRFVGKEAATEMFEKDLCLEEYIENIS